MKTPAEHKRLRPTWRTRWRDWWLNRLPRTDALTLTQRNVYILPTRAGWMLAVTLLLLLVGSINYQLNLGYMLTFLLAGSAAVSMHVSHNNLRGLELRWQPGEPVFAGQPVALTVTLHNPSRRHRYGIALRWLDTADACATTDAPALSDQSVELRCRTTQRGHMRLPALELESRFPLGTFRVWSWWRPAGEVLVYPAPEVPTPPLPLGAHAEDGPATGPTPQRHGDETDGLRPYRRGDPLKWVAWKKVARLGDRSGAGWVSRDFSDPPSAELWLDIELCGLQDTEGRVSRLCAWVLQAEAQGLEYGLRLPDTVIQPGRGPAHRRQCLEALACC
jgi:uncharacterized protein (DUF58 family)